MVFSNSIRFLFFFSYFLSSAFPGVGVFVHWRRPGGCDRQDDPEEEEEVGGWEEDSQ